MILWGGTLGFGASVLWAQSSTEVRGTVLDAETERALDWATVRLVDDAREARETITSSDGTFRFSSVRSGSYTIHATRLGYAAVSTTLSVEMDAGRTLLILLTPEAVPIEPINVDVEARPERLVETGFYDRNSEGLGTFFQPGVVVRSQAGYTNVERLIMAFQRRTPSGCSSDLVPVFLDGRPLRGRPTNGIANPPLSLGDLAVNEIGAVEVYPDAAGLPGFALGLDTIKCGAVILWSSWMTRPRVGEIPTIEVTLCEPSGAPGEMSVDGIVEDELTAVRLPAARVSASYRTTQRDRWHEIEVRTDSIGRFRLCNLPTGGEVVLTPSYGPYVEDGRVVDATTHDVIALTVKVTLPGSIVGRVLLEETGRPILGRVPVVLVGTDYRTETDPFGRFAFGVVPPGSYVVQAECGGFDSSQTPIDVEEVGRARVTVFVENIIHRPADRMRRRCDN